MSRRSKSKKKTGWEGKVVKELRFLSEAELACEAWQGSQKVAAVEFTDGSLVYAACDPEGNGPGALFGVTSDGQTVWVNPA
ncbi:MAG: hypothetical protein HYX68_27230 [Planctomycetes bacterium]|nr:hypothetical protein [Planctomycetota bacterium]